MTAADAETGDVLRHILRPRPSWATGPDLTECGNLADITTVDTRDVWAEFVKSKCRGSVQRGYATYCVTCSDTVQRNRFALPGREPLELVIRYLTSHGRDRAAEARIVAELEAIALLIAENDAAFTETVMALLDGPTIGRLQ